MNVELEKSQGVSARAWDTARVAEWLQGTLAWATLATVLLTALANGGMPPVAWVLMCLTVGALFAIQLVTEFIHSNARPQAPIITSLLPAATLFFLLLAWLAVQAQMTASQGLMHPLWTLAPTGASPTISADPEAGRDMIMRFVCYAMIFWVMMRASIDAGRAQAFIKTFAIFSTGLAIYGLFSVTVGQNFLLGENEGGVVRASFFNRNSYATFAVFGILANMTAYYRVTSRGRAHSTRAALRETLEGFFSTGWIYALGTLICLAALVLTASRAGAFAALLSMFVLFISLRRRSDGGTGIFWIAPLAALAFVIYYLSADVVGRFAGSDTDLRFTVFPAIVEGIWDRAILGHGAGAFQDAFRSYVPFDAAGGEWQFAHSSYLENAFEFGLPAAVILYVALALVALRLVRGIQTRQRNRSIPAFAFACFVAAAVHSIVDFSLQIPAIAALFVALLGIGWAQSFSSRPK